MFNSSTALKTLISFLFFFLFSFTAFAQSDKEGIGIKPAIINDRLDLNAEKSFSFSVVNLSDIDQVYYFSKKDIVGARENGEPIFAEEFDEKTDYEMSGWISFAEDSIAIPKGESRQMSFKVKVPNETSPGDHFASIITSSKPPEINKTGASVGYQVANIVSIRIPGDIKELAKIREFSVGSFLNSKIDIDFKVKIENEGNVLVRPVGIVDIKNMFGKTVATVDFNKDGAGVIPKIVKNPEGTRIFNVKWQEEGLGFGRYEASLSASYGDELRSSLYNTVSFWILPANIIIPTVIALIVIFLIIYFIIKIQIKRKVDMLMSSSSRRLVNRKQNQFPVFSVFLSMLAITCLVLIVLVLVFSS